MWLQPQEFSQLITEEALAVRKRVELQEILVFETTLITHSPTPSFSKAIKNATKKLYDDEAFHMAIDIARARKRKIRPLGVSSSQHINETNVSENLPQESLEEAPNLPGFDVEITVEPQNANDRVSQWQRKLLDLTARNRLLHLPEKSKHVPLCCHDPGELEDLLAAGKTIQISSFPDFSQGNRDEDLYKQQNNEDLRIEYARESLKSHEVISSYPEKNSNPP